MESFLFFPNAVISPADGDMLYFRPCAYLFVVFPCLTILANNPGADLEDAEMEWMSFSYS